MREEHDFGQDSGFVSREQVKALSDMDVAAQAVKGAAQETSG